MGFGTSQTASTLGAGTTPATARNLRASAAGSYGSTVPPTGATRTMTTSPVPHRTRTVIHE